MDLRSSSSPWPILHPADLLTLHCRACGERAQRWAASPSRRLLRLLRHMPENACRIEQPPWLQLGRARRANLVAGFQSEPGNACPPLVQVGDQHVHHEIIRPILHEVIRKQERKAADADIGKLVAQRCDFEAEVDVKLLAGPKILGRYERP